jgi:hypothetical protein
MKHALLALALLAACGTAFAQKDISKVNGAIETAPGQTYGELDTVNGGIRIRAGATVDSAETVNGGIRVEDRVQVGALETVNGGIRIGESVQVGRSVETVNGGITIDRGSRVEGKVETVNGGIVLTEAEVGGGLETVGGDITVGADSVVRGGIAVRKPRGSWFSFNVSRDPRIVIGPRAVVEGGLVFDREVELFVHDTAKVGAITGATPKPFSGDRP